LRYPSTPIVSRKRHHRLELASRKTATLVPALAVALLLPACGDTTLDLFAADRTLVAHWALDEQQRGARVIDASGHGNDGVPSLDAPVPSTTVPAGGFPNPGSLSFDGISQLVEFGNPPILNIFGPMTVCAWFNASTQEGPMNIVAHGYKDPPKQEVALRMFAGYYQFSAWNGGFHDASWPIPPGDLGKWTHLCGAFDGDHYLLYRNGVLVTSKVDKFIPVKVDAAWAIGGRPLSESVTPERMFAGLIDDVRIYSRALSDSDVAALHRR